MSKVCTFKKQWIFGIAAMSFLYRGFSKNLPYNCKLGCLELELELELDLFPLWLVTITFKKNYLFFKSLFNWFLEYIYAGSPLGNRIFLYCKIIFTLK